MAPPFSAPRWPRWATVRLAGVTSHSGSDGLLRTENVSGWERETFELINAGCNSLFVGAMVAARYNPQLKSFRDKLVANCGAFSFEAFIDRCRGTVG
jgi:hypothetical protein